MSHAPTGSSSEHHSGAKVAASRSMNLCAVEHVSDFELNRRSVACSSSLAQFAVRWVKFQSAQFAVRDDLQKDREVLKLSAA